MSAVNDQNKVVYWAQEERCNAPAPSENDMDGMLCSLQDGHPGGHEAWWNHNLDDELAFKWPRPVTPQEEAEAIESILRTFGNTSTRPPPPTEGRL